MISVSNEMPELVLYTVTYFAVIICIIKCFIDSSFILTGFNDQSWFEFYYGLTSLVLGALGTVLINQYGDITEYSYIFNMEVVFVCISIVELICLLIHVSMNLRLERVFQIGPYFGMKYLAFYMVTRICNYFINVKSDVTVLGEYLFSYFIIAEIVFIFFSHVKGNVSYGKNTGDCRKISGSV